VEPRIGVGEECSPAGYAPGPVLRQGSIAPTLLGSLPSGAPLAEARVGLPWRSSLLRDPGAGVGGTKS